MTSSTETRTDLFEITIGYVGDSEQSFSFTVFDSQDSVLRDFTTFEFDLVFPITTVGLDSWLSADPIVMIQEADL